MKYFNEVFGTKGSRTIEQEDNYIATKIVVFAISASLIVIALHLIILN